MDGVNIGSLVIGAVLGLVVSLGGLWVRHNWERYDADQKRCRSDLVELLRSAEAARVGLRRERIRSALPSHMLTSPAELNLMVDRYGAVAESVFAFSTQTRRLRSGSLRFACASYAYALQAFHLGEHAPKPLSSDALDAMGALVRRLVEGSLHRLDDEHHSLAAIVGRPVICPPEPYSTSLPDQRS